MMSLARPLEPGETGSSVRPELVRARGGGFWFALTTVAAVTAFLHFYKLGEWPWDHDEVPSLIELGVLDMEVKDSPGTQTARLPKLVPVWFNTQRLVLQVLPRNELGSRILSAGCGVLAVVLAFAFVARSRGLLFGAALAVVLNGSQCLIWLSQQNRFYTTGLLFLVLTWAAVWTRRPGPLMLVLTAVLAALAILSHNLLVVVFVISFGAAWAAWLVGVVPTSVVLRTGVTALVSGLVYLLYLRPLMQGWISGGTGGTNELVSFAAQAGVPTLALAGLGIVAGLAGTADRATNWWSLTFAGGLLFIAVSPLLLAAWNPRYALLFMPPMWFLAAVGVETVARRLPSLTVRWAWFGCVALLLLPKLASHYQDGSRHDFRGGAQVLVSSGLRDQPVFCNWTETLQYYLLPSRTDLVHGWDRGREMPQAECYLVYSSNLWDPVLQFPGRKTEVIGELFKRRFDEQSHVVRVYHLGFRARPASVPVKDDTARKIAPE